MKKTHWLQTGTFIAAAFYYFPVFAQTDGALSTDNKLNNKMDSIIDIAARAYLRDSNTNGLSIGVYQKTKKYTYNYGKGKLATASNFYNIGSVAKTFVTTLLAQAVVEKKLALHNDIRKFLPGRFPNLTYRGSPIQVIHLANHTSALPIIFRVFPPQVQDSLRKLNLSEQANYYSRYNRDSLLTDLHKIKPDTLPGAAYQYNSSAMMVLVLILERIYHQPFEKIVTGYLATHLHMFETKPYLETKEIDNVVQGYNNNRKPQAFLNLRGYYFGPTMNSTINDMLTYIEANLMAKEEAIKLTHKRTYGTNRGFGVGLGWMLDETISGERYLYHDGNTKIGYNTLCTLYPDETLGFIIIANDTVSQARIGEVENTISQLLLK